MLYRIPNVNFLPNITISRKSNTSEGFTAVDYYRNELPLNLAVKCLTTSTRWSAGRSSNGRLIMRTRGRKLRKNRQYSINYKFRDSRISLVAGLLFRTESNKLFSLLFLSSGSVTYVPTTSEHQIFRLTRFRGTLDVKPSALENPIHLRLPMIQSFFLIHQLPKNQHVCLLEVRPGKGVQYARAVGSKAKIIKMDSRISTGLVKLPSGVKKIFSIYGLGSPGTVALPASKKMINNRAGNMYNTGRKPTVRGVAMNPVDHPHGGRTKTIHHPRTPWGKTTKLK